MRTLLLCFTLCATFTLAGCDQLGIESASVVAARKEAESKAIGAGCRHAARSVEECYSNNRRAEKAAVFAGWKEMNDYMRENSMAAVPAGGDTTVAAAAPAEDEPADKAGDKAPAKPAAKGGARPAGKSAEKR